MRLIAILMLLAMIPLGGCRAVGTGHPADESDVDQALTQSGSSATVPEPGPGEPQKGFHQELVESQNP